MPRYEKKYIFGEISGVKTGGYDVIIDTRERSSKEYGFVNKFVRVLDFYGYTWIKTKLPAGDILINRGRGLVIERKTTGDLISTAWDQRADGNALDSELKKLTDPEIFGGYDIPSCLCCEDGRLISIKQTYEEKEVIKKKNGKDVKLNVFTENRSFSYKTEGGKRRHSKLYPNSWIAITERVQYYTHYYEFAGVDHLISWIISRLKREIQYERDVQRGVSDLRELRMSDKVNRLSPSEQQRYILEGFYGLGPRGADKCLTWAGTLRNFFVKVNVARLLDLGITTPVAEHIVKITDHRYKKKEKS